MPPRHTEKQFLQAYDQYADALYRYCFFHVRGIASVAEDLVQETFTRTWQALSNGTAIKNFRAFLYQTAKHLIIDRSRLKSQTERSLTDLQEQGFDPMGHSAKQIEQEVEVTRVLDQLEHLSEKDRDVFLMRFVEGYGPKDIANILNDTPGAISVRITRAKKLLHHHYVSQTPTSSSPPTHSA